MRVVAIIVSLQVAAALQYKSSAGARLASFEEGMDARVSQADDEPECNGCKYAYVTMWIAEDELPRNMIQKKGAKLIVESNEQDLTLTSKQEQDAQDFESGLEEYTNHLSGKEAIWELATNLASVGSKYPLIVLTNEKNGILKEQEALKEKYPNIEVVAMKDYLWPKCTMRQDTITHFQKLSVLGMERYDKLLWIDADIRLRKNIDYTFALNTDNTAWFMKDNWFCDENRLANGGYSSGFMLFKPTKKLLEHTLAVADNMGDCIGDQVIIQRALKEQWKDPMAKKMALEWIPDHTVRYPQCDASSEVDPADAIHFVKTKKGMIDEKKVDI